ncbi:MAG: HlyD family efflux transporter periplasmic adaptor subunit [Bacteroidetes bacterium]|nr:HlyD family efflux transporter periplasmic adaptor subunit [Bacteroidota bacterium]MBU1578730.1 HlyD family efflux transporter periplasmic adaptor subunit [Bacteroidota bacterium]MBU2559094.1 HlyD family efflux transporter periplasmic adaptor subunit [Bacteroidota bacterium]
MKSRVKIYISLGVILALILITWYATRTDTDSSLIITAPVKKGNFVISVSTTGELEAKSSEKIYGPSPSSLREARLWQLKIEDIIADGSIVDSGDYVARLDRAELTNKIKDQEIDIETFQNNYTKTQLDTTMDLRAARNELVNLRYAMEEAQIAVDQSIYEPPATQRQVQIELDRAERSLDQAIRNYSLKYEKAVANMSEVANALRKKEGEYEKLVALNREFTITAPKAGMVVYQRDWDGKKRGVGSTISAWENVVATLPNLREMITKTYVNEIDISKVKTGQRVEIGVDAFPEKNYTGQVIEVANIGEQMRNSNAKVFEVKIEVNEFDSILRPAMTTKNVIITNEIEDVVFIPLEGIFNLDTIQFVYTSGRRQQVIAGKSNDNEIVIKEGLKEGDVIRLSQPEKPESYKINYLDPEIVDRYKEKEKIETTPKPEEKPAPKREADVKQGQRGQKGTGKRPN